MSLKSFHLFFIGVSTALCFFLLIWGVWDFRATGTGFSLALAVMGALGLLLLVQYFKWFRKKWRALPLGFLPLFVPLYLFLLSPNAQACGVCYADPDSPLTKGALVGVMALGGIVVTVLALIVVVARTWMKRANQLRISL